MEKQGPIHIAHTSHGRPWEKHLNYKHISVNACLERDVALAQILNVLKSRRMFSCVDVTSERNTIYQSNHISWRSCASFCMERIWKYGLLGCSLHNVK